jgi:hypothetical protein
VSTQSIYFIVSLATFIAVLVTLFVYFYQRSRRLSGEDWKVLVRRITVVNRDHIALVALDLVDESGQYRTDGRKTCLDPPQIWDLIGGLEGLMVLRRNCVAIIDLACYVQQWYPEAIVFAEQFRLNAREIEWHIERLEGAAQRGNLEISFPAYAQRAVATYYLMTRRLLTLYKDQGLPILADLQQVL